MNKIKILKERIEKKDIEDFREDIVTCSQTSDIELVLGAKIAQIGDEKFLVEVRTVPGEEDKVFFLSFPTKQINLPFQISCITINDKKIQSLKENFKITNEVVYLKEFLYDRALFRERLVKSKNLKRFIKKYNCIVKTEYDKEKVSELFKEWQDSFKQRDKNAPSLEKFLIYTDEANISKYNINILYFEIDDKLVGIKVVFPHSEKESILIMRWGVFDKSYIGLEKYMDLAVVEKFTQYKLVTDCGDFTSKKFENRLKHKLDNRKPDYIEDIYIVDVSN